MNPILAGKNTLFHYWRSSASWRARAAIEFKNLPCERIHVHILNGENETSEFLEKNPYGYVPVLKIGAHLLTESVAIIEFLDELMPEKKLYPTDPFKKAQMRAFIEGINAGIQPLQNIHVLEKVAGADEGKRKEWTHFFNEIGLEACETLLKKARPPHSKFCFGNEITAADLFLVPQIYSSLRFEVDMKKFPVLHGIYLECLTHDVFKKSHPDRYKPD